MDTNNIMVNDEVIETTAEIATASYGKGFKMAAGIGLAVMVGVIAYNYIAKPMLTKIKTAKEQPKVIVEDINDFQDYDDDESEEK